MKLLWTTFKKELEFKRQIFHLVLGLLYAAGFLFGFITPLVSSLLLIASIFASFFLRKRRKLVDKIVLLLERKKHLLDLPLRGLIFFLLGATLTIAFFDFFPALAGLVILSVADSLGTLYGKYLGVAKIRWNPDKHMEGPILGGFVAAIMCMSFLPMPAAVVGAYVGAFLDTLKIRIFGFDIDDNLLIPIVSAGVIQVMLSYGAI